MDLILRDLLIALGLSVIAGAVLVFLKMGNLIWIVTLVVVVSMVAVIILRLRPSPPPKPAKSPKAQQVAKPVSKKPVKK